MEMKTVFEHEQTLPDGTWIRTRMRSGGKLDEEMMDSVRRFMPEAAERIIEEFNAQFSLPEDCHAAVNRMMPVALAVSVDLK